MSIYRVSVVRFNISFRIGEKENLDSLIKKVVSAKEVNHKGQGLWVTLRKLHGDFKKVRVGENGSHSVSTVDSGYAETTEIN